MHKDRRVHAYSRRSTSKAELGNISLRRRIATQLVVNDLARHRVRTQHTPEEALCRGLVAPPSHQTSRSPPCSLTARHNRYGSPRSVTNISSTCHVLPGLRRAALAHRANPVMRRVISCARRWYFRFNLSLRDVEELLLERGVVVTYEIATLTSVL